RALHERLAPLAPTGVAILHDEDGACPGAALELACTTRLPLVYVLESGPARPPIAPADPFALAERVVP
ncbi:MAG: hypothetical protein WBC33_00890, partial [Conexibacter sp.]